MPDKPRKALTQAPCVQSFTMSLYKASPWRGCAHGCVYCDGRAEKYWFEGDFERDIEERAYVPESFAEELKRVREYGAVSFSTGVTDAYQPKERTSRLTRACLEALAAFDKPWAGSVRRGLPAVILTKSDLVTRDIDLLSSIASKSAVLVLFTVTTLDEKVSGIFEPRASPPSKRLEALSLLKKAGCYTGVLAMPVLPFISDAKESVTKVFNAAREAGADYVMPGGLTLRPGRQKEFFMATLRREYPDLVGEYTRLYGEERPSGMPLADNSRTLGAMFDRTARETCVPWAPPSRILDALCEPWDAFSLTLRQMEDAYSRKRIDTRPLGQAAERYDAWLKEIRGFWRRRKNLEDSWLSDRFAQAKADGEVYKALGNEKLSRFMETMNRETLSFDVLETKLIPNPPSRTLSLPSRNFS